MSDDDRVNDAAGAVRGEGERRGLPRMQPRGGNTNPAARDTASPPLQALAASVLRDWRLARRPASAATLTQPQLAFGYAPGLTAGY
jgi:hypothetical protein